MSYHFAYTILVAIKTCQTRSAIKMILGTLNATRNWGWFSECGGHELLLTMMVTRCMWCICIHIHICLVVLFSLVFTNTLTCTWRCIQTHTHTCTCLFCFWKMNKLGFMKKGHLGLVHILTLFDWIVIVWQLVGLFIKEILVFFIWFICNGSIAKSVLFRLLLFLRKHVSLSFLLEM